LLSHDRFEPADRARARHCDKNLRELVRSSCASFLIQHRQPRAAAISPPGSAPSNSPIARALRVQARRTTGWAWDVGHQAYPHKALTGRRDRLAHDQATRRPRALPASRSESEYDTFGVGHSSTSISAALGMARPLRKARGPRRAASSR
jgi:hypothetical protein